MDTTVHIKSHHKLYDVTISDDKNNKIIIKKESLSQEEFNKFFLNYEKIIKDHEVKS